MKEGDGRGYCASSTFPAGLGSLTARIRRRTILRSIGEGVRKAYEEVLVPAGMGDVAIFTELGRFMLAPYGCAGYQGDP